MRISLVRRAARRFASCLLLDLIASNYNDVTYDYVVALAHQFRILKSVAFWCALGLS